MSAVRRGSPGASLSRNLALLPQRGPYAVAVACALLAMAMAWRVPMMLWDHLDLVPIYEAWMAGELAAATLFEVHHGSHFHVTAYGVLLLTTGLSSGDPWLDCFLSWALLMVYAGLVLTQVRQPPLQASGWHWYALVTLALYPGHLANLQWGWQVAVFVCLALAACCIRLLARERPGVVANALALVCAALASLSFSTGLALFPVAAVLIALRRPGWRGFCVLLLPWLLVGSWLAWVLSRTGGAGMPAPDLVVRYALNFLGGGVARYATAIAPWLALFGVASGAWLAWRFRAVPQAWPWIAWMVFGAGAAGLTAMGRAEPFGVDHAFVTRYVSFSSTFWLGWFGLAFVARKADGALCGAWLRNATMAIFLLAGLNALHLIKKAGEVGAHAASTSETIRTTWPEVDEGLLEEIYFGRGDLAIERLRALHARGFAPFGE